MRRNDIGRVIAVDLGPGCRKIGCNDGPSLTETEHGDSHG